MPFLFDLDGTLANTFAAYYAAWSAIAREQGVRLTPQSYRACVGSRCDADAAEALGLRLPLHRLSARKDELLAENIQLVEPVPGAVDFVRACAGVAVVTNSNRAAAQAVLRHLGLAVDVLVAVDDVSQPKPHPEPFARAAALLGAPPEACVAFEDSALGVRSALAAGVGLVVGIAGAPGAHESALDFLDLDPWNYAGAPRLRPLALACAAALGADRARVLPAPLGGGFVSRVHALECRPGPSAVLKLPVSGGGDFLSVARHLELHSREVRFYQLASQSLPVRAPRLLGLVGDVLVLEDLRGARWRPPPQEVAAELVASLAALHLHFWGQDLPLALDELHAAYAAQASSRLDRFLDMRATLLAPEEVELVRLAVGALERIGGRLRRPPLTLCHGDAKAGNCCLLPELCLVDWQYAGLSRGAADLAFFLAESGWALRGDCEELLRAYHGRLGGLLSWEELLADLRLAALHYPLFVAIWFGSSEDLQDPDFPVTFVRNLMALYRQLGHDALASAIRELSAYTAQ